MTLPPSPALDPTLQSMRFLTRPYAFLRECAETLGDAFTLELNHHGTWVVVSHPDAVRAVFRAGYDQVEASRGNAILAPLLGSGSLLLLDGARHARQRRLLMPAFHGRAVAGYAEAMQRAARREVDRWAPGDRVVVRDAAQRISLEVILRVVLGLEEGPLHDALAADLSALLDGPHLSLASMGRLDEDLGGSTGWQELRALLARLHDHLQVAVEARRGAEATTRDVLGLLLEARDETGEALTDGELRDELLTLAITGHETTATAAAWAVHLLLGADHALTRLHAELRGLPPDPVALARAPWLDAVIREALRMRPILPIVARAVTAPLDVGAFTLPAGVTVAPCVYLVHHRDDLYPEPDRFRPQRFLERSFGPHEHLPFGGGARRCLGMAFADLELKIVLREMLSRFELAAVPPEDVRPVRRTVTVAPSDGAVVEVGSPR